MLSNENSEPKYNVVEIFASIDGEGRYAGCPAIFIRLAKCNLSCSWCDSRYAWANDELTYEEKSISEVINNVDQLAKKYGINHVTLTGGEPLISKNVDKLIDQLTSRYSPNRHYTVNIETNGAIDLWPWVKEYHDRDDVLFTMDWKCPSSSMNKYMREGNLAALSSRYSSSNKINDIVKFVVSDENDLEEVIRVINMNIIPRQDYYISPVFGKINPENIVKFILDNKLGEVGARIQLQLHKIIWDPNERGV